MSEELAVQQDDGPTDQTPSIQEQLAQLDREIRTAMSGLRPQQRRFVRNLLTCNSATEAARKAGYAKRSAHSMASRLLTKDKYRRAYDLLSYKDQLQHGMKPESKRAILATIAEKHIDSQPRAAVSAVNELNRMDGGHKPLTTHHTMDTSVTISYDIQLPGCGNVVEGEVIKPELPATDSTQSAESREDTGDSSDDQSGVTDAG